MCTGHMNSHELMEAWRCGDFQKDPVISVPKLTGHPSAHLDFPIWGSSTTGIFFRGFVGFGIGTA